jgi:P27 family predicted phage terminase small subunit
MRGRKPKPTAVKQLTGNPGKRKLNAHEPKPPADLPICPSWLDDEAKRQWNALVPHLHKIGLLTMVDQQSMAAYCQAVSRWAAAEAAIAKEGLTFETEFGPRKHPAVTIAKECMLLIQKFASEFGLSPSARTRIEVPAGGEDDDLEAFLKIA